MLTQNWVLIRNVLPFNCWIRKFIFFDSKYLFSPD